MTSQIVTSPPLRLVRDLTSNTSKSFTQNGLPIYAVVPTFFQPKGTVIYSDADSALRISTGTAWISPSGASGLGNGIAINGNTTQTAVASAANTIAVGNNSTASGAAGIAIGSGATAGLGANATGVNSIVLGPLGTASGLNSYLIGGGALNNAIPATTVFQNNAIETFRLNDPALANHVYRTLATQVAGATITLTAAQAIGGVVACNNAGATSVTLPTAAQLDTALTGTPGPALYVGMTFKCSVYPTTANAVTIVTNTGITAVGVLVGAASKSFELTFWRTAAGAWTCVVV